MDDGDVSPFRDVGRPIPGSAARAPAGGPHGLHLALLAANSTLDRPHGRAHGLRLDHGGGLSRLPRLAGRSLGRRRTGGLLHRARADAARHGAPRAHRLSPAHARPEPARAPDHLQQLPDAGALARASLDAQPEHELFPGRVRRPGSAEGDADGARHPRGGDQADGGDGLRRRLLHWCLVPGRPRRSLADGAARPLARGLYRHPLPLRAQAARGVDAPGGRPGRDDRPRRRQLHQYPDRQAVRPQPPRAGLCAGIHGWLHGDGVSADAARHQAHHLAAYAERRAPRRHCDRCGHRLAPGVDLAGRACRRDRRRHAYPRHVAVGALGGGLAVREHRHGPRRHQHADPRA